MTFSRWALILGIQAGSLWWICSAIALSLPLYYELALPYRERPDARLQFWLRCLLVVVVASVPGGSVIGAALVVRERAFVRPCMSDVQTG